jgi:hypothetical protein
MVKKIMNFLFAGLIVIMAAPVISLANPGPVMLTGMERAEWHSSVIDPSKNTPTYESATFLYSLISAYRKLDTNVSGSIYYINKFDLRNNWEEGVGNSTNIFGVSVTHDISGKWRTAYSYSHAASPEQNAVTSPKAVSNRLSVSILYKFNPGPANKRRYSMNTSFNTGTKFSLAMPVRYDVVDSDLNFGRTISEKLQVESKINKRLSYDAAYSFIGGIRNDDPVRGVFKEQFANQYELNFNYSLCKKTRVVLGYMYLNNLYNGAYDDDNVVRMSIFEMF